MDSDIYCSPTVECTVCHVRRPASDYVQDHVGRPYTTYKAYKVEYNSP
jgi:hypothetical protein